jgi:hypothetical protein
MTSDSKQIKLRAHHLLCLQGFQGYGYDQDFADNMSDLLKRIDSEADIDIIVTAECDDICAKCPHVVSGICQKEPGSDQKVREMDRTVLLKLELSEGAKVTVEKILDLVNEKFASKSELLEVCGDCQWRKKCLHFIFDIKVA